jgi:hypothetical protein
LASGSAGKTHYSEPHTKREIAARSEPYSIRSACGRIGRTPKDWRRLEKLYRVFFGR